METKNNWKVGTSHLSLVARTFVGLLPEISVAPPPLWSRQEKHYSYLNRTLVEFIVSILPSQLLRPGQRRSLMPRSLANLLPIEVLSHPTKATSARSYVGSLFRVLSFEFHLLRRGVLRPRKRPSFGIKLDADDCANRARERRHLIAPHRFLRNYCC